MLNDYYNHEEKMSNWLDMMDTMRDEETSQMGIFPSPPDPRDYDLQELIVGVARPKVRPKSFINPAPPFILDQQQTSVCGGATAAGVFNCKYHATDNLPLGGFSMTFPYWVAKNYDGIPDEEGTYIRTILKVLNQYGICRESQMPFLNSMTRPLIRDAAYEDAKNYKIAGYAHLWTHEEILEALGAGFYVMIGTFITSGNWDTRDGYLSYPRGAFLGGHATFLYGYDDNMSRGKHKGHKYGINSWGASWGDLGKYYMPYDYYDATIPRRGWKTFLEAWAVRFQEGM